MLNTYKFDIIALSETWIKDNHHHLDYIKYLATYQSSKITVTKSGIELVFTLEKPSPF